MENWFNVKMYILLRRFKRVNGVAELSGRVSKQLRQKNTRTEN